MKANEKPLEAKLRKGVTRLGGLCLKVPAVFFTGIPDRLCLLPGGRVYWAETKSTGKDLSPRQRYVKKLLEGLGFTVFKVDSEAALAECLREIEGLIIFQPPTRSKSYFAAGGPRFLVKLPGCEVTVEPYNLNGLTPEELAELKELETAQNEIRRRDPVDDLSRKDLRRLKELRTLNY